MMSRLCVAAVSALLVSGCSILSEPEPVRLFRFGQSAAPAAPAAAGEPITLIYTGTSLPRASAGDRILTTDGVSVSYIGGSRWAAPALIQFEEAVVRAFANSGVRLLRRGGGSGAAGTLRVEVRDFEVRYAGGAPTVVLAGRALINPVAQGAPTLERPFAVERPAGEDRVSAIAAAFDAAVSQTLTDLVAWAAATPRPAPSA